VKMKKIHILSAALLAGSMFTALPAGAEPEHPAAFGHRHVVRPAVRPGFARPGFRRPGFRFHPFYAHRPFARFSVGERAVWTRGHWRHARFHGRFGWWFVAGGGWYFYPQPVYPYPDIVSDTYYQDESDYGSQAGGGGQSWYYCQNPKGYYPYVKSCNGGWQTVPATPPDQSGYDDDNGAPDQDGDYDNGPPDSGPPDQNDGGYDNGPPDQYDSGPYDNDDNGPR
jgi:hypothetical protein